MVPLTFLLGVVKNISFFIDDFSRYCIYTCCMKYFILFIDDFSCYRCLYLAASVLEVFCEWVEWQLDRKVKVVKSDRGMNSLESMMKVVNVQIH